MARFRENAERVRHLHQTLSREILALQKQKGAKAGGAPKGPAADEARAKVAELKRAAIALMKSNGVLG
jgi:DNA invertase Pin-like site-specific DNA recombinase